MPGGRTDLGQVLGDLDTVTDGAQVGALEPGQDGLAHDLVGGHREGTRDDAHLARLAGPLRIGIDGCDERLVGDGAPCVLQVLAVEEQGTGLLSAVGGRDEHRDLHARGDGILDEWTGAGSSGRNARAS